MKNLQGHTYQRTVIGEYDGGFTFRFVFATDDGMEIEYPASSPFGTRELAERAAAQMLAEYPARRARDDAIAPLIFRDTF